jgi:hypothetical protein
MAEEDVIVALVILCKPSAPLRARCACALEAALGISRPRFYAARAVALDRGLLREEGVGAARVYVITREGARFMTAHPPARDQRKGKM